MEEMDSSGIGTPVMDEQLSLAAFNSSLLLPQHFQIGEPYKNTEIDSKVKLHPDKIIPDDYVQSLTHSELNVNPKVDGTVAAPSKPSLLRKKTDMPDYPYLLPSSFNSLSAKPPKRIIESCGGFGVGRSKKYKVYKRSGEWPVELKFKRQHFRDKNISISLDSRNSLVEFKKVKKTSLNKKADSIVNTAKLYNARVRYLAKNRKNKWCALANLQETNPIADILSEIECSVANGPFSSQAVQSMTDALIHSEFVCDKSLFLYYAFQCVYTFAYAEDADSVVNFSLRNYEKALVSSLMKVGERDQSDLLLRAIESLHMMMVRKFDLSVKGLSALCRVFAEMCRLKNLVQKPVLLSLDLIMIKHRFISFMIASLVGVWSEPFEVTETTADDEKCLFSAVAFGAFQMSPHDKIGAWNKLKKPILEHLERFFPHVSDNEVLQEVIEYLIFRIHSECVSGSPLDIKNPLFSPIIAFAGYSELQWVEENILEKHVIPSIYKYGNERNETAFGVFCDLFVHIFSYRPMFSGVYSKNNFPSILMEYFGGEGFVRECAAVALIRLRVLTMSSIPDNLMNWLEENSGNPLAIQLEPLLQKYIFFHMKSFFNISKDDFEEND